MVLISTGTMFTRWLMTAARVNIAYGLRRQSYWGTLLRSSDDFGKSWTNPQQAPIRFPADTGVSLKNIWQITLGRPEEPNVLYCGVEPAALFETRDAGETWSLVRGLFDHPHRPRWMPGNGGLALHTILLDPADNQRMYVAISSGGVYRTNDGGTYLDRAKPGHPGDVHA